MFIFKLNLNIGYINWLIALFEWLQRIITVDSTPQIHILVLGHLIKDINSYNIVGDPEKQIMFQG